MRARGVLVLFTSWAVLHLGVEAAGSPLSHLYDHLRRCLEASPPVRGRLKLVYAAIPKTGSRYTGRLLTKLLGTTSVNPGCGKDGPAFGQIHIRPQTTFLMDSLGNLDGSLRECDGHVQTLIDQGHRQWRELLDRLSQHPAVPVVAAIRDPAEHLLSLFSQQSGWRSFVQRPFEIRELREGEPAWAGALRRFISCRYPRNFQLGFLSGKRFQDITTWMGMERPRMPPQWSFRMGSQMCDSAALDPDERDLEDVLARIRNGTMVLGQVE